MAKIPTKYYKVHPYKLIEEGFDPARAMASESVFSLANEYSGVRGFFDEGYGGKQLIGSYFNGIYDYAKEDAPMHYKGIVRRTHFMVNSVNYFACDIVLGGKRLDLAAAEFFDFTREVDFLSGELRRAFTVRTKGGANVRLEFSRFLSMTSVTDAYQSIVFSADADVDVVLTPKLDFDLVHWGSDCFFCGERHAFTQKCAAITLNTLTTNQQVGSAFAFTLDCAHTAQNVKAEKCVGLALSFTLKAGRPTRFYKTVCNLAEKAVARTKEQILADAAAGAQKNAQSGADCGYGRALALNKAYFKEVFDKNDIVIEGDAENQQGIRFCIFQLHQTYHGADENNNIGAKGLTGEAYSGHAFWDTETFCLPYYLFNNIKAAKNLLMYRYKTLGAARERAKALDCRGACYPIATLNGKEGCTLWQHASLQFQPSTGVFYGIYHYMRLTNDKQFMLDYGCEMLVEICRFLVSRGDFNADGTRFGYYAVMGPDEFQMMVNHNAYTNYMAKRAMEYTLEVLERFPELHEKYGVTDGERESFCECARKMYIPQNADGLIEQHEGFFGLPHVDIHSIPVEDFPLYSHWSYDRIYRNDIIKQPDVLMFMFLFGSEFDKQRKLLHYAYYEPRCIHESSLSPCIHSVFAAELGREKEAVDFFGFATRMDIDDYNRNTAEGLHTTSIAGAWINIVYGFGGLKSDGKVLALNPMLPSIWGGYSFNITAAGKVVNVAVDKKSVVLSSATDDKIELCVYGKAVLLQRRAEIAR